MERKLRSWEHFQVQKTKDISYIEMNYYFLKATGTTTIMIIIESKMKRKSKKITSSWEQFRDQVQETKDVFQYWNYYF